MELVLKKHNQKTYQNLCHLLNQHRKAAIIQPPLTGKSILSLKYIKDFKRFNPNRKVLYITRWKTAAKEFERKFEKYGISTKNVEIISYSALRKDDFFKYKHQNHYGLIITDEYQYAGAEVTSQKLKYLLNMNPDALFFGTSATPVRYLDNQKDMTEILFDNHKASDMSLEDALVSGLLPNLEYITALQSLDTIIDNAIDKNLSLIDNPTPYILELVKQLQNFKENQIGGVREIFKSYMKNGEKYVVFCKDIEHLEYIKKGIKDGSIDWFKDIDSNPNIYSIYSTNTDEVNEQNYTAFVNQKNNHLSLLLNINMATESLHFISTDNDKENSSINGEIMLRSTSSANLFVQMIGRAFSINTDGNPKIFDLVDNIYNDYSIYSFKNDLAKIKKFKNHELKSGSQIEIIDKVIQVESLINKLEKVIKYTIEKEKKIEKYTYWDKMYYKLYDIVNKIKIDYPGYDLYNDLQQKLEDTYLYRYLYIDEHIYYYDDYNILKWTLDQLEDFKTGTLPIKKINILKNLDLIPYEDQYKKEEQYTIDMYFSTIDNTTINKDDLNSDIWKLKLAKYFVDNYYHYQKEYNFELSDYINEVFLIIQSITDNRTIENLNGIKIKILSRLKQYIKDNSQTTYLDDNQLVDNTQYFDHIEDNYLVNHILGNTNLNERNKTILIEFYGLNNHKQLSLTELSEKFDISRSRVSEIIAKSTRQIRNRNYNNKYFQVKKNIDSFNQLKSYQQKLHHISIVIANKKSNSNYINQHTIFNRYYISEKELVDFFTNGQISNNLIERIMECSKKLNEDEQKLLINDVNYIISIKDKIKPKHY